MSEDSHFKKPEKNLIRIYQERLDLHGATFSRVEHSEAMVAKVYKITDFEGEPLILKICSRQSDYDREGYFLNYFSGLLPVPQIRQLVPPERDTGVDGAILMDFLPGSLLSESELTPELAYETGELLAKIHLHAAPGYGDLTQVQALSRDPSVHFTLKFEEGLEECRSHLPKKILDQCARYYDSQVDLFELVDGPCFIHRDFRPANIIVFDGKVQGLIDWSSGRGGFAQEDFCALENGEWELNSITKQSFLEGYASFRKVPAYEEIMPLLSLNRAIALMGFTVREKTWGDIHHGAYQISRQFIEQFFIKNK